jgi:hypothetical protein
MHAVAPLVLAPAAPAPGTEPAVPMGIPPAPPPGVAPPPPPPPGALSEPQA